MADQPLISHELAQRHFHRAFGMCVGMGRPYSAVFFSEISGICGRTIRAYQGGEATPGLGNYATIKKVLGPAFTNQMLSLSDQAGARWLAPIDPCGHTAVAQISARLHALADAMRDGRLDHIEKIEIAKQIRELITEMEGFVGGLDRDSKL